MQILPSLLVGTLAIIQPASPDGRIVRSNLVLVRSVVDGNTIDVSTYGHVRLLGIDAPRVAHGSTSAEPFGKEARDRLAGLLLHHWIRLEHEVGAFGSVSRRAAYVMTGDGVFVNELLVREGLARVAARGSLVRLDELKKAEADAQLSRRGMWSGSAQIPSPSYTRPSGGRRSSAPSKKKPPTKKK